MTTHTYGNPATRNGFDYNDDIGKCRELESLIIGKQIGSGGSRRVYECAFNESKVIKLEWSNTYQNIIEWETWERVRDKPTIAKWFAPCIQMSRNGLLLIQTRAEPLPKNYHLPRRLPGFLSDIKADNFGLINGALVCTDYGTMLARAIKHTELTSVTWE